MEDDSSHSQSALPRPLAVGAGSHQSRGSVESHGSAVTSRSAQSGSGAKIVHSAAAARGATPPPVASRDVNATPPASRPSGAFSASVCDIFDTCFDLVLPSLKTYMYGVS